MLKDFTKRSNQPELMDDFQEPIANLKEVFDDINSVNEILGGNNITVKAVEKLIKDHPQENYTIVDMGCGDGNMLRAVAKYYRKKEISVTFIGIDLNKRALQIAKEMSTDYPEISYQYQDILELNTANFQCDILLNTLTMHHFTDEQLLIFIKKFSQLAKIGVVINDLERSLLAYYLFKLFSLVFIKTKVAKIDGCISISKGFKKRDLVNYAKSLPTVAHQINWKWAFRYVWVMKPNLLKNV